MQLCPKQPVSRKAPSGERAADPRILPALWPFATICEENCRALIRELRKCMENWSYKRNGAVEGPVSKDRLKSLYDAGEITRQTLVRSSSSGGAWRRYGDVADLHPFGAQPRIPRAVKHLWPWFVFGTPLVGGLIDVFLIQSTGNEFVESNSSWLSHAPIGVNILAIVVWCS
jgi:GYF domain 2